MASGKSVVGVRLASRLKRPFVDLDQVIEEREGAKVHEIFDRWGEAYFRKAEKEVLKELLEQEGKVIATGGGAIVDEENLRLVKETSLLVCLKASPETVLRRSGSGNERPLLRGEDRLKRIEEIMDQRERFYAQAHLIVNTDSLSVAQVVEEIIRFLHPEVPERRVP